MEVEIICKAGLTESQAKGYLALIENGALSPALLAEKIGEKRTNGYMIAERLVQLGLAKKSGVSVKKMKYEAEHPAALEALAERRRKVVAKNEKIVKDGIAGLIEAFYANSEMPYSKTMMGVEGIKEVYADVLRTGKDVYVLRSVADVELGGNFLSEYRSQLPKLGITTYILKQDTESAREHIKIGRDEEVGLRRVLMPVRAYTAPVAIHVYGDKSAFLAFGETQMATVIDSPAVAEGMRQVLGMLMEHFRVSYPQEPDLSEGAGE